MRNLTGAVLIAAAPSALAQQAETESGIAEQLSFIVAAEEVQDRIDRKIVEHGVPSISVAAVKGDGEIWAYASGLADKEAGRAATVDTPYRLASVSKPITAVAIMMLADRGVIDLDNPANAYLADQKITAPGGNADEVTVRQLMAHRGGLPLHYNLIHEGEDHKRRSLDETIAIYGKAMLPPGVTDRYSNVGYGVLERIIEVHSGKSYDHFLADELFEPLGMNSAGVVTAPVHPDGAAIPYTRSGERYRAYDMDTRGAGGIYMTASDLVRFGRFFSDALDGRSALLSREAAREMLEMQAPSQEGKLEYYVLGWVHELRGEERQYDTIYHLGSTPGVRAELWIYPDEDLIIATQVNEMLYRALNDAREAVIEAAMPGIAHRPYASRQSYRNYDVPSDLQMVWTGTIDIGTRALIPVSFDFRNAAAPSVTIDGKTVAVWRVSRNDDGIVTVNTSAIPIPTEDSSRQPYDLGFQLSNQEARLFGYVSTNRIATRERDSGSFAYAVELQPLE
ncbi:MAG: serine hydrolase domain-containing protein [Pseudomonadota bacterium]